MKRVLSAVLTILIGATIGFAQTTFYFPQVADGVQDANTVWKTTIFLTNPAANGTSPASGTISFFTSAGAPFNITFVDEAGATVSGTVNFTIVGGQTKRFQSTSSGALTTGFGIVNSPGGTVSGTAVFSRLTPGGTLLGEAGVPAATAFTRQAVFIDTLGGFNIGVAYANPNAVPANVTLQLRSAAGQAVVGSTTQSLAGSQHAARFTSELFPTAPQFTGTMQIISDQPLAAIALRFDPAFNLFTTLPPVSIASLMLNPAIEWMQASPWLAPLTSIAKLLGALQFRLG